MSVFLWLCLALGIVAGLLEVWSKNKKQIETKIEEQSSENATNINFNYNKKGTILVIAFAILTVLVFMGFSNLGKESIFTGNNEYEEIAQEYIEEASREYLSYMKLVDASSYSLDQEVRVTLKYRFTEGTNTSYSTYVLAIDKDTKEVVGFSQY